MQTRKLVPPIQGITPPEPVPHRHRPCRRVCCYIAAFLVLIYGAAIIAIPPGDRLQQSPVAFASSGFTFDLLAYEIGNFPDKWVYRVLSVLPWVDDGLEARQSALAQYEELARSLRDNSAELQEATAQNDHARSDEVQREREQLLDTRDHIRDTVEEYLEAELSLTLASYGFRSWRDFIWPPVDFRIDNPPSLLMTSPRNVIARRESRLIETDLTESEKLGIENQLLNQANLSAIVLRTGGLAAFPNIVPSHYDLLPLLEVSAHEWLHAYLLFQPLGRAYWDNGDMTSLNETLAQIFGKEIGRITYNRIKDADIDTIEPPPSVRAADEETPPADPDRFDFREFMFETRQKTDTMLADNRVADAEGYMEQRRRVLVENGYNIRKLNQAYFAFHGLYAAGAASTSPLARQLWELRLQSNHIGGLVKTLQTVSDYAQFHDLLDSFGIER